MRSVRAPVVGGLYGGILVTTILKLWGHKKIYITQSQGIAPPEPLDPLLSEVPLKEEIIR